MEDAVKYKNKVVYAKRGELHIPEGANFICDLLELPVIDSNTGKVYGKLTDVLQYTCQEVYEVTSEDGKPEMSKMKKSPKSKYKNSCKWCKLPNE